MRLVHWIESGLMRRADALHLVDLRLRTPSFAANFISRRHEFKRAIEFVRYQVVYSGAARKTERHDFGFDRMIIDPCKLLPATEWRSLA